MAFYLGSKKLDFNNGGARYIVNSHTIKAKIKSSDGYYVTDKNGTYITLKEDNNLQNYIVNNEQK